MIPSHRLSELIGSIYDCTIDPNLWPETIGAICAELRCTLGVIQLIDLQRSQLRFVKTWNFDMAPLLQQDPGYADDVMYITKLAPLTTYPIGEAMATSRLIHFEQSDDRRWMKEVAIPTGMVDSLQTIVLRNAHSVGLFAGVRHSSVGFATDDDLEMLLLFVPHIRRAVTISDLLDMKSLEANALSATLDRLATGVVIVADENRIIHANAAAQQMMSGAGPLAARHGKLSLRDNAADGELTRAVALARREEATLGGVGIGIAIGSPAAAPSVAHVLPLAGDGVRRRLMPQAAAAVFVTAAEGSAVFDFGVLAQTHGLTPAEICAIERLTTGATISEAAADLSISITTAKTHLSRIFSKTGVSRQADLISLIHRLAPPIRVPRT